jgi:hypothetical protein
MRLAWNGDRIRAWLWPVLHRLFPSAVVHGVEIADVGLRLESMDAARVIFEEALEYLRSAGGETWELVSGNLRRVAIVQDGFAGIAVREGKYATTLQGHEGRNPFYLACRLLWIAQYIALSRSDPGRTRSEREIRDAAFDRVMSFAAQYEEEDEWVRYMERERMRDLRVHD